MSAEERETLSLGLAHGHSLRTMATVLGRAPSTLSRSLRACTAHTLATGRARQPRRLRKLLDPWLWQYVRTHLAEGCSPEQIAGRLRREYPDDMRKHLSSETICIGTLRSELLVALRQARKARRPRARGTDRRGHILNMTSIAERPAEVATRTVPGHWEGDLIKGARNGSAVGTLVERTTRLVILARMEGTDARSACLGFTKKLRHVPAPLRKTLTYDRGKEMAEHEASRSVQPVAARHQREHQWAAAPVLAQGHGLVALYPARVERHRPVAPEKMLNFVLYATASLFTRCTWNLKLPSLSSGFSLKRQ